MSECVSYGRKRVQCVIIGGVDAVTMEGVDKVEAGGGCPISTLSR